MSVISGWINLFSTYPKEIVARTNHGDWTYRDQQVFDLYYGSNLFGVRNAIDYALDERRRQEYFNAHRMDYNDVHDPRNLPGAGNLGRLASSIVNFTSSNIKRLYGD